MGLLVQTALARVFRVPLLSRIQEHLVFFNRDKRTLLDKFVRLLLPITDLLETPAVRVADAWYYTRKVIRPF